MRDEFSPSSYGNNHGTQNWLSNWAEFGDNGRVNNGDIAVAQGRVRFRSADAGDALQRRADLTGALSATLSYDWEVSSLEEEISVFISTDGVSYDLLETLTGTTSRFLQL